MRRYLLALGAVLFLIAFASPAICQASESQSEHKSYWDAFSNFLESDISIEKAWAVLEEGISNGLNYGAAVDRVGTELYCPEDYPTTCSKDNETYVLIQYVWSSGCRGYNKDCCVQTKINCRAVMMAGESAAMTNITLRDEREACTSNNCVPSGCTTDSECTSYYACPSGANFVTTMRCDVGSHTCYCASACPDTFCDYKERLSGSCFQDCGTTGNDSDMDGLSDLEEETIYGTNKSAADSDHDGLTDWEEVSIGSDPTDPDTDNGGQCDGPRAIEGVCRMGPDPCPLDSSNLCYNNMPYGANVWLYDSDNDGTSNGADPCPQDPNNRCPQGNDPDVDANGDGIPDSWARQYGVTDPNADPDNDGLTNSQEYLLGTNPLEADSDSDGLPDGWEFKYHVTDPNADDDHDGLTNLEEYYVGTDPTNPDSNGNGIPDGQEGLIPDANTTISVSILDITPRDSSPDDGIYTFKYGQTVEQIVARIKYSTGKPVVRPAVAGKLLVKGGAETVPLQFKNITPTSFAALPDYDVLEKNKESPFMTLEIMVADPFGKSADFFTKLFVPNSNEGKFRIEVNEPRGKYAYWQVAPFDVRTAGDAAESVSVMVFVEGLGTGFPLVGAEGPYIGEYLVTENDPDPLYFLVYANGTIDNETYESIRRAEVNVDPTLTVEFVRDQSTRTSYAFTIAYPNGEALPYTSLKGTINELAANFTKIGDYYIATLDEERYNAIKGQDLLVDVTDSHGNVGRVAVPSSLIEVEVGFDIPSSVFLAIVLIAFLSAFVAAYELLKRRRAKRRAKLYKLYKRDGLLKKRKQLEEIVKDTREQYYKKRISEEYASKKIADSEEELKLVNEELGEMEKMITDEQQRAKKTSQA